MSNRGRQLFGVANYRPMNDLAREARGGTCLLNGREVTLVWFADTEAGIVKTFEVLGDGKVHATRRGIGIACYRAIDFPGREVECELDEALSETLHGKVELFAAALVIPVVAEIGAPRSKSPTADIASHDPEEGRHGG